ncbi:uncharacterized protein LOC136080294 [Hydra vulgaris]|uniref:Uncharacterized protein LOC136080294 n=1 Tax=Hydra vulgaris TaxID=6087 RepID=A0ABM4BUW9_HYDVU
MCVSDENKEILTIELINKRSKNILISCCYRPPAGRIENFGKFLLKNIIKQTDLEKKKNYCIGDFNINSFDYYENQSSKNFFNGLFETGTIPLINRPTRITSHSSSLIDNILTTDFFNKSLKKGIIKTDVSDHFPIFFSICVNLKKEKQGKVFIKKRLINNNNLNSFREQLSLVDWGYINFNDNINIIYDNFFKTFHQVYDSNFPLIEIVLSDKEISSPWITKGLRKSSKIKQKLYIKYLKSKSEKHKQNYKTYTNLFEKLRKSAKKNYYSNLLNKYKHHSKRVWQIMKEVSGKLKPNKNLLPNFIQIDNKLINDSNDIAFEFNKLFTTIGTKLSDSISFIKDKSVDEFETSTSSNLNYTELTFNEFEVAFKSLKRNKATGYDDINTNIVIDSYDVIKDILYKIFRASIAQGSFPDKLKIAKVTPIFKTGDRTNITNYRPISVLPVFSKILERIMYNRIYSYLVENKILYENQFGFKKNNSTEHAILQLTRNITDSFKDSCFTLGVFIDLSKAFDTINHQILLKKLISYVSVWFKQNRLSLNIEKTKWTLFYPPSKKQKLPHIMPDLLIDNIIIKREKVTKFLGVYIDENLSWRNHIDNTSNKIAKCIGILYKARNDWSEEADCGGAAGGGCAGRQDRRLTAPDIAARLYRLYRIRLAVRTVRARLQKAGLNTCVAAKKPLLTCDHRRRRRAFALIHRGWTIDQWKQVLWSDESSFQVFSGGKRVLVRRRVCERYHSSCINATVKHGGGSIMVWGCISWIGQFYRCVGAMNQDQYTGVLRDYMLLSAGALFGRQGELVFQQDNAPCHKAKWVCDFLTSKRVRVLEWPP